MVLAHPQLKKLVKHERTLSKRLWRAPFLVPTRGLAEFTQIPTTALDSISLATETSETATNLPAFGKTRTLIKTGTVTVASTHLPITGGFEITGTALTLDASNAAVLAQRQKMTDE